MKRRSQDAPKRQRLTALAVAAGLSLGVMASSGQAADASNYPTLNVVDTSPLNWLWVTWNTMEEAVRVSSEGRRIPTLATSWKWIDPTTLQLNLRKDVTFQNGEKFTAKQFQQSFQQVNRWHQPHPPGTWLNWAKEAQMEIMDDHTVRIKLPKPDGAAFVKLRGMHIGDMQFWKRGGFVNAHSGSAEGHW